MDTSPKSESSAVRLLLTGRNYTKKRAASLLLVYVLVLAHIIHWRLSGKTLAPLEFNEARLTLEVGIVTAGFLFMAVAFASTAIFGRFFCSWGCHILALEDGCSWLLDKLGTARLMPFYQVPMVAAFVFFAYATSPASALFGFFFLALSTGANMTLPNAFWAEFYGTAHLGSIKAMAAAVMVLGSALGPGLTGVLIDAGVGIEAQYIGIAAYFIFTTVMMQIGVRRAARLL